jgi:hypothetical protein
MSKIPDLTRVTAVLFIRAETQRMTDLDEKSVLAF